MNKLRTVIDEVFYNTLGIIWHILRSMAYSSVETTSSITLIVIKDRYMYQIISDIHYALLVRYCSMWISHTNAFDPLNKTGEEFHQCLLPALQDFYMNWNSKSISSVKVTVSIISFLNKIYISCKFLAYKLQ